MKRKNRLLPTLLLLSSVAVAALGGYIKYGILEPLGIHREESIMAMPFVLYSDKGLQFMIEINREASLQAPTEPLQTEIPTEASAEPTGQTVATEPPVTETEVTQTVAPETEPATLPPTEVVTEVPSEPAGDGVTAPPTEVVTEVPPETSAEVSSEVPTEVSTESATVPPTVPPTEPPTESGAVELPDSWFDDMLVIGDSRIQGMRNYYRFGNAYYFTSIGMNIYNVFGTWVGDQGHYECSLDETLKTIPFGKVLIGIGLNECNYDHTYIRAGFEKLIGLIHTHQPDTKIILTSVMMVTEECSRRDPSFSIENLTAINEIIKSFADGEKIFYIDVNEWAVGEDGYLIKERSFDGIHFYGTVYVEWATWLRQKIGELGIS